MKYELLSPATTLARSQRSGIAVSVVLAHLIEAPFIWLERAQSRRQLAVLDDHMLRDIGISRAEAEEAAGRPFWRS